MLGLIYREQDKQTPGTTHFIIFSKTFQSFRDFVNMLLVVNWGMKPAMNNISTQKYDFNLNSSI